MLAGTELPRALLRAPYTELANMKHLKVKGLADRVRFTWDQDIALERLIRIALKYRRAIYKADRRSKEDVAEVERLSGRLLDVVFELPPGVLRRAKRWRMNV